MEPGNDSLGRVSGYLGTRHSLTDMKCANVLIIHTTRIVLQMHACTTSMVTSLLPYPACPVRHRGMRRLMHKASFQN